MRKNILLVDFENVQPESLARLYEEHFRVIVFVGAAQGKVPVELAMAMQRMGTNAEYVKLAASGKNALDFHIAYYLGKLAAQDPEAYFHVVSRDTGFDPLIQYLKSQKVFASRSPSMVQIPLLKQGELKSSSDRAHAYMEKLQDPKVTRARSVATLARAIGAFFHKQLSEDEVQAIIQALRDANFLQVVGTKVIYA